MNSVLPGFIKTARIDQLVANTAKRRGISKAQAMTEFVSQIPMGYIGSTEEIARTFLFLGSDMSSYVSGASIPVDGALLRSVGYSSSRERSCPHRGGWRRACSWTR